MSLLPPGPHPPLPALGPHFTMIPVFRPPLQRPLRDLHASFHQVPTKAEQRPDQTFNYFGNSTVSLGFDLEEAEAINQMQVCT